MKEICNKIGLSNTSQLKKTELIELVFEFLQNSDVLCKLIQGMNIDEFESFIELLNNEGYVSDKWLYCGNYLSEVGVLYVAENFDYIPNEIYNILIKMDFDSIRKIVEENSKLYNLLKSMVRLYGVVNIDDVVKKYEEYYDEMPKISRFFFSSCLRSGYIDYIHIGDDLYFVHNYFILYDANDLIEEVVERQEWIIRKEITIDELLKYRNSDYYENTSEVKKYKNYLKKNNFLEDDKSLEEFVVYTIESLKFSNHMINDIVEILINMNEKIDFDKLFELLVNLYNNLIIYNNNGWTPIEMRSIRNENN